MPLSTHVRIAVCGGSGFKKNAADAEVMQGSRTLTGPFQAGSHKSNRVVGLHAAI